MEEGRVGLSSSLKYLLRNHVMKEKLGEGKDKEDSLGSFSKIN